jgi:hypothetical protein
MNCFVIMPFSTEFDDVYAAIKSSVEPIISSRSGKCSRLDESNPAGRITDRLLREIQVAAFTIADVTGSRPNVMWEVGYAMALQKPTILLTQKITEIPFDIKDMLTLEYSRNNLSKTLSQPLRRIVLDTIESGTQLSKEENAATAKDDLVGTLLVEIQGLKEMIGDVAKFWKPIAITIPEPIRLLKQLEGAWVNKTSGTNLYARVINGELIMPYCYHGNDELTGIYFDWKRTGEHWFSRFCWLKQDISGFAFYKQDDIDTLSGAWWHDTEEHMVPDAPPKQSGVPAKWERFKIVEFPTWAIKFLNEVEGKGLSAVLANKGKISK